MEIVRVAAAADGGLVGDLSTLPLEQKLQVLRQNLSRVVRKPVVLSQKRRKEAQLGRKSAHEPSSVVVDICVDIGVTGTEKHHETKKIILSAALSSNSRGNNSSAE